MTKSTRSLGGNGRPARCESTSASPSPRRRSSRTAAESWSGARSPACATRCIAVAAPRRKRERADDGVEADGLEKRRRSMSRSDRPAVPPSTRQSRREPQRPDPGSESPPHTTVSVPRDTSRQRLVIEVHHPLFVCARPSLCGWRNPRGDGIHDARLLRRQRGEGRSRLALLIQSPGEAISTCRRSPAAQAAPAAAAARRNERRARRSDMGLVVEHNRGPAGALDWRGFAPVT